MLEQFLLKLQSDIGKIFEYFKKFLFSDGKAFHICVCFVDEAESDIVANLEPANNS